jgi:hypothetical protein
MSALTSPSATTARRSRRAATPGRWINALAIALVLGSTFIACTDHDFPGAGSSRSKGLAMIMYGTAVLLGLEDAGSPTALLVARVVAAAGLAVAAVAVVSRLRAKRAADADRPPAPSSEA